MNIIHEILTIFTTTNYWVTFLILVCHGQYWIYIGRKRQRKVMFTAEQIEDAYRSGQGSINPWTNDVDVEFEEWYKNRYPDRELPE